jgi:hypothetical protein
MSSGERKLWVVFVMICMTALSGVSQTQTSLDAAYALQSAARPAAAIAMVQSLLDARMLSPLDTARALDLEGIYYEDMGESNKAVHALEEAQRLLGTKDSDELGAVLDNLGGCIQRMGILKARHSSTRERFASPKSWENTAPWLGWPTTRWMSR